MRYQLLGKSGLRVSELCLGTMTFGTEWGTGSDKADSQAVFQRYLEAGGNFLDTANHYTNGTSEKFIADFAQGMRQKLIYATKYTLYTQPNDINDGGNHRKNLVQSVEGSLQRLQTDYIDVLYIHAWDYTTPVEEVMRGLDDLVRAGKVLYIGISDTPAWVVSRANMLAELRGWTQFIGLQIEYSLVERTPERELLPMAKELDMSVLAWAPLGAGLLTGKYLESNDSTTKRMKSDSARLTPTTTKIAQKVVEIARRTGYSPAQIALAWVKEQGRKVIPIIGARRLSQLEDNLKCLEVQFSEEDLAELNAISQISLGFPHEMLGKSVVKDRIFGGKQDLLDF